MRIRAQSVAGRELIKSYEQVGRQARDEVTGVVSRSFRDDAVAARLTTEIIRNCR